MARSKDNIIMRNTTGAIGKEVVFKIVNGKTIVAKYPDMSQVEYNKEQIEYRELFAKAVDYAKDILYDPIKMAEYQRKIRKSKDPDIKVYNAAVKEYMALHSRRVPKIKVTALFQKYLLAFKLDDRPRKAIKHLIKSGELTNAIYQRINKVSKATATRDLKIMVEQLLITPPETKGAGAVYRLIPLKEEN